MTHLLINALSVTNPSGEHVLTGHVREWVKALSGSVRFTVLCREDMTRMQTRIGGAVEYVYAPSTTSHWFRRRLWERLGLPACVRDVKADLYFTPSGIVAFGLAIPQIVFAQNPWALVPSARRLSDAPKAWLQRRAYRRSMKTAEVMVFNSRFMQDAYRQNAGCRERQGRVVYQAPDDETRVRAADIGICDRTPGQIVSVSVWGPHKNVEALLQALRLLKNRRLDAARLVLIGSWPHPGYELKIRDLVRTLDLDGAVNFAGYVDRAILDRTLAESQVFCLMSRCESFGIPAVEAQNFGTPVISSAVCAIPEICGEGGRYCDPDDVTGIADALQVLLEDPAQWATASEQARRNAERFTWSECSRPLVDLLSEWANRG